MYLTVGQLANKCGISTVAIRYYEKVGLLPKSVRRNSGYKIYPETIIHRINFIKNAKSVGFTLEEINKLLMLEKSEHGTSQEIKSCTIVKLESIYEKIHSLEQMANILKRLVTMCDGKVALSDCPILRGLYGSLEESHHPLSKESSSCALS